MYLLYLKLTRAIKQLNHYCSIAGFKGSIFFTNLLRGNYRFHNYKKINFGSSTPYVVNADSSTLTVTQLRGMWVRMFGIIFSSIKMWAKGIDLDRLPWMHYKILVSYCSTINDSNNVLWLNCDDLHLIHNVYCVISDVVQMRFSKSLARMFSFLREFHSCVCGIKVVIIETITIQKRIGTD